MMEIHQLLEQRGKMYNVGGVLDPETNFQCAIELANVFEANRMIPETWAPTRIREKAHAHAIRMLLMKVARIATGAPNAENYIDAIGYLQLAQRIALREEKHEISSSR